MNTKKRYIKFGQTTFKILLTAIISTAFFGQTQAQIQTVVSPFKDSETLAEYKVDFAQLVLAESADIKKLITAEGQLVSHIYRKPANKSNLEVVRSYEQELKTNGFTILSNSMDRRKNYDLVQRLYDSSNYNSMGSRPYKQLVKMPIRYFDYAEYYLAAKKQRAGKTIYVAIFLTTPSTSFSQFKDTYLVDVLETGEIEEGTVEITEKIIEDSIAAEGKAIIYSIYFDTDKAEILPESRAALETIAKYLKNHSNKQFYIVGHTDDTGGLTHNMNLSERRASAVVYALQNDYGVNTQQIEAKGVGPISPVASNETAEGRQLNRRVELVLKSKN